MPYVGQDKEAYFTRLGQAVEDHAPLFYKYLMQLDGVAEFMANGRYIRKTSATMAQMAENRGIEAAWLQSLAESAKVRGGPTRFEAPYAGMMLFEDEQSAVKLPDAWAAFRQWKDEAFDRGYFKAKEHGDQTMWARALAEYGVKKGKDFARARAAGISLQSMWLTFPRSVAIEETLRAQHKWLE